MTDRFDEEMEINHNPFARALGLHYVRHDAAGVIMQAAYDERLVGDPDTGVLHGGVITAMLDNACGMAVRLDEAHETDEGIATLDLRIDYMGAAEPNRDIQVKAHCYKRTRNIAFVRGVAYTATESQPVATCVATFMLSTRNRARAS